ncbi:MAG: Nif3-like dinuclear metal center hexameric protein [Crocinitomicaceae bacterium]|nr:Nif3-like dinuclear metal center hexameric protein [Crocinitomicaceae bacterium]|tara:strand:+ start:15129 stop:16223 length:1095 start_codon:yes stop_codon:yes gene_type:complete
MLIAEIIDKLEEWAPPSYQENYDNAGLICGNPKEVVSGVLVCLDSIEDTIDEAIKLGCNLIIAHHPIVFKGLKKITSHTYVERTLIKAIKNDVAIYAMHTNLDSVTTGVNYKIGNLLGVKEPKILAPQKGTLEKLVTYCPNDKVEELRNKLFEAGAGKLGDYDSCSFNQEGIGTFRGLENSNAYVGEKLKLHSESETKIEVVLPTYLRQKVIKNLLQFHPYEEVAYEIYSIENENTYVGSGMVGELADEITLSDFFDILKKTFHLKVIRHTGNPDSKVRRIAWCGGAGSFLLKKAIGAKADIFITGDFKYHEFFDHENKVVIADIGHYESEQFTAHLIVDFLKENFNKFAVHLSGVNTNPVNYY